MGYARAKSAINFKAKNKLTMAYFFKVVSVTTQNNNTGNGKNQVVTIGAETHVDVPLEDSGLTQEQIFQLVLSGRTTWIKKAKVSLAVTRVLFGDMKKEDGSKMRDGALFNSLNVGDSVAGDIFEYDCLPYQLPRTDGTLGEPITKGKVFVFENEDALAVANRQLVQNNSCVVIDGKPTVDSLTLATRFARNEQSREASQLKKEEHLKTLSTLKAQMKAIEQPTDEQSIDNIGG